MVSVREREAEENWGSRRLLKVFDIDNLEYSMAFAAGHLLRKGNRDDVCMSVSNGDTNIMSIPYLIFGI